MSSPSACDVWCFLCSGEGSADVDLCLSGVLCGPVRSLLSRLFCVAGCAGLLACFCAPFVAFVGGRIASGYCFLLPFLVLSAMRAAGSELL